MCDCSMSSTSSLDKNHQDLTKVAIMYIMMMSLVTVSDHIFILLLVVQIAKVQNKLNYFSFGQRWLTSLCHDPFGIVLSCQCNEICISSLDYKAYFCNFHTLLKFTNGNNETTICWRTNAFGNVS